MRVPSRLVDWLGSPELLETRERARKLLGVASGLQTRARINMSQGRIPGLLSIVVPMYGVERYIAECLESLLKQNYRNIEIVVVDDGSPDESYLRARRIARRDPRVRIIRQENGGLSAARNTGVAHARGEYLAFLDSDDFVDRHVYQEAIESLIQTGSEFAVLPYRREKNGSFPEAAPWIRAAHAKARKGTRLEEFPEIMVNAVAWSKVYRRDFWDKNGFEFPVGMLYEDQALSMAAFAAARSFDVLDHIGINWRIRGDQSSITQQVTSARNISHHAIAVRDSFDVLGATPAGAKARPVRALQIINFNLGEFLPNIREMDSEAWHEFLTFLRALESEMDPDLWGRVEARRKVLIGLCLREQRDLALEFLDAGGWDKHQWGGTLHGSVVEASFPLKELLSAELPDGSLQYSAEETQLDAYFRRMRRSGGHYEVDALAFVHHLPPEAIQSRLDANLVDRAGRSHSLKLLHQVSAEDAQGHSRRYAQMSSASVRIVIPIDLLHEENQYEIQLGAQAGEFTRSATLRLDAWSEFSLPALLPDRNLAVEVIGEPGGACTLQVQLCETQISALSVRDDRIDLQIVSDVDLSRVWLRGLNAKPDLPQAEAELLSTASNEWRASLRMPWVPGRRRSMEELELGVTTADGQVLFPRMPSMDVRRRSSSVAFVETKLHSSPREQLVFRERLTSRRGTRRLSPQLEPGRVCVRDLRGAALVTSISVVGEEIVLQGFTGPESLSGGVEAINGGFRVHGSVAQNDALFEIRIPLAESHWGLAPVGLKRGRYRIRGQGDDGRTVVFIPSSQLLSEASPIHVPGTGYISVGRSPRGALRLAVSPDLPADQRGRGDRLRMRDEVAHLTAADGPSAFLFRNLYGEAANDSALAVYNELQRRGTAYELIWAVQDASVPVPAGARRVLEDSREYYEAFRTADFLMVNVHQPIWHRKSPGQRIIQTFHGYPFKLAGRRWWDQLGVSAEHRESYFRRAEDWDYLVSPAKYATAALAEFFRTDDQIASRVLEIGYPRNDALIGAHAEERRAGARARLGIPDGKRAILYAPTFRDYLSADDMSAELFEAIDIPTLMSDLGPDYVFLLRGHPFNARAGLTAGSEVLNVTEYPDINDLILASDIAVLDYSSVRFDIALTDTPMLFYVPDRERYFAGRTSFLPYEVTAPAPHLTNQADLTRAIQRAEEIGREYASARTAFVSNYMSLEDGNAARRLVDELFPHDKLHER